MMNECIVGLAMVWIGVGGGARAGGIGRESVDGKGWRTLWEV